MEFSHDEVISKIFEFNITLLVKPIVVEEGGGLYGRTIVEEVWCDLNVVTRVAMNNKETKMTRFYHRFFFFFYSFNSFP